MSTEDAIEQRILRVAQLLTSPRAWRREIGMTFNVSKTLFSYWKLLILLLLKRDLHMLLPMSRAK